MASISSRSIARIVALSLAISPATLLAQSPYAPQWTVSYGGYSSWGGTAPEAARMLPDGSFICVGTAQAKSFAMRGTADDTLQSGVKWESYANFGAFSEEHYEIGPAGEVLTTRTLAGGGVEVMKLDGFTGRATWSAPTILDAAESVSPRGLAVAPSGDIYTASMTSAGAARIARLNGVDGAPIWSVTYDTPASDDTKAIEALPGGGVVILVQQGSDFSTVAFEPTFGGVAWSDTIATPAPEGAAAMTIAPGGDIVIGGTMFVAPNNDALVVKYSASGTRRWLRTFDVGSTAASTVSHLVVDGGDDVFVAGGTQISPNPRDWLVARLDGSDGGVVWATTFGDMGANEDLPSSAVVDGDGNFIVSGTRIDSIFNYAIVKFANSDGSRIWTAPQGSRTPRQLVLHPAGDVFSFGIGSWSRADVVRFRGIDGAHYQPLEIAYPVGQGLAPDKIVHDAAGNAFVLGTTGSTTSVTKITSAGTVVWSHALSEFTNASDVATDSAGDVVLAGNYSAFNYVSRICKLSGATGDTVWVRDMDTGSDSNLAALVVDAGDNVYATGLSDNWTEALTAKVSSAGAEQWRRFSALAGSESGRDIVLDSAGNIVVVGQAGSPSVAMILRYDPAGALVSPVTLGTTSGVTLNSAIADAAGNVYGSGNRYDGIYDEPHILMVDPSGTISWSDTIAVGQNTFSGGLALTPYGAAIIGSAWAGPGGILSVYSPAGIRRWIQYIALDERTELRDIDVTDDGGIVVAGRVEKATGFTDTRALFAKFDSANGDALWTIIRDNGTSNDGATCLDAVGNDIYVGMAAGGEAMVARYGPALGILQLDGDLPVAYCNTWYSFTLAAANGSGSYSWSTATGLPPGVTLSSSGELSGTPASEGSFTFTVIVNDGSLTFEREFTLDVWGGSSYVAINASADPLCQGDSSVLSLGATYGSYDWLPTHEATPSISVTPLHPAIFGANLDAAACSTFGSIVVDVVPTLAGVSVSSSGSTTVCEGATAGSLTVLDTGGGARTHQWWYRTGGGDSFAIPGETGRTWVIDSADLPGPGTYEVYCVTTPQCGVPTESNAMAVTYPQLSAPSGLVTTASAPDSISLVWAAGSGSGLHHYNVYRSIGLCPGGTYVKIGESAGLATNYVDTTALAGITYSYMVAAASSGSVCESARTTCAHAVAHGDCTARPTFAGLASVGVSGCLLRLSWEPATSACPAGPDITYSVYRSTDSAFTPAASNLIATCVPRTHFDDETAAAGTTYYYIVRAEDGTTGHEGMCGGGNADLNTVRRSGVPSSAVLWSPFFQDSFEVPGRPENPANFWTESPGDPNLAGLSTCRSYSAPASYRLGPQASCATGYATNATQHLILGGAEGIALPAAPLRMRFQKRFQLNFWQDVALFYKTDIMTSYEHVGTAVVATAPYIASGGYNSTVFLDGVTVGSWGYGGGGSFSETVVNLDAITGRRVSFRWTFRSTDWDPYDGFYLDNVSIESGATTACSTTPGPVPAISATSTNGATRLEFVTGSSNYANTVARFRTDGAYPTSPFDGYSAGSYAGLPGTYGSITHTGETNDTTHLYSIFVDNGAGRWSPVKTIRSRPQSTAGSVKWIYNTGATAMTPPGLFGGASGTGFVASNDRLFHGVMKGASGGVWPGGWLPLVMNAPSQSRTLPLEMPVGGVTRQVVLVGSQDGKVYCIDAQTGALVWASPDLGEMVQGSPSAISSIYGAPFTLVFAASRDADTGSKVYALDPDDGSIVWTFDNSGAVGGDDLPIGVINDGVIFRYVPEASGKRRAYFASRRKSFGSQNTLWAVEFDATSVTKAWAIDAGEIDGFPYPGIDTLYVGTIDGKIQAVRASDGAMQWGAPLVTNDGGVKVTVWPDAANGRLYFATTNYVWAAGTDGSVIWRRQFVAPSTPNRFGARLFFGAGDGKLYQIGNLLVSDPALLDVKSIALGDPSAPTYVGDTTIDRTNSLVYVGTGNGAVYAVAFPLP